MEQAYYIKTTHVFGFLSPHMFLIDDGKKRKTVIIIPRCLSLTVRRPKFETTGATSAKDEDLSPGQPVAPLHSWYFSSGLFCAARVSQQNIGSLWVVI